MGYSPQLRERLEPILSRRTKLKILEFGDQQFTDTGDYFNKVIPDKYGHEVTTIDIMGNNGAINLDLSKPLPDEYVGKFDIVTNFGTSEHIGKNLLDQITVFQNMLTACKFNGLMINEVPEFNHWPGHCNWYYTLQFFMDLDYLWKLERINYPPNGNNIFAINLRTKDSVMFNENSIKYVNAPVTINEYWKDKR